MSDNDKEREKIEQKITKALEDGKMEAEAPEEAAHKLMSPPYEIRIQSKVKPVAEETKLYRSMAREIDDRYDDKT